MKMGLIIHIINNPTLHTLGAGGLFITAVRLKFAREQFSLQQVSGIWEQSRVNLDYKAQPLKFKNG